VVGGAAGGCPGGARRVGGGGSGAGFGVGRAPAGKRGSTGEWGAGLEGWSPGGSPPAQVHTAGCAGLRSLALGRDFMGQPELGGGGKSTVSQSVAIPQTQAPVYLSLLYQVATLESEPGHDWLEVLLIDGTTRYEPMPPRTVWQTTQGWQLFVYDLSPWRGRTVQLILNVWQDSSQRPTVAFIDQVSVGTPPTSTPSPTPKPPYRLWVPMVMR